MDRKPKIFLVIILSLIFSLPVYAATKAYLMQLWMGSSCDYVGIPKGMVAGNDAEFNEILLNLYTDPNERAKLKNNVLQNPEFDKTRHAIIGVMSGPLPSGSFLKVPPEKISFVDGVLSIIMEININENVSKAKEDHIVNPFIIFRTSHSNVPLEELEKVEFRDAPDSPDPFSVWVKKDAAWIKEK